MQYPKPIASARAQLLAHPLAHHLSTPQAWRIFMAHHAFAVWDFMSLAKRLQRELTCVSLPWRPAPHAAHAHFINSIVLAEESDSDGHGGFASHFELYLRAMDRCQADRTAIDGFMQACAADEPYAQALHRHAPAPHVEAFVSHTLACAMHAPLHVVAGVFFFGREDIIPNMFSALDATAHSQSADFAPLVHYLQRHVELDGDSHGPLAAALLEHVCGGSSERRQQAHAAAAAALHARCGLWDGIVATIRAAS